MATFKDWLSEKFTALDSVRNCVIDRGADVTVFTWGGAIIQVHLLDAPFKTRQVRKIVSDNSRVGVGTLFLAAAALMPPDGEQQPIDEGLLALHALFKDKVYTYRIEDGMPYIGQVHFKSFGRGDDYEVLYGPDIQIRGLPFYRVWIKTPSAIKGEWLMANFGTDAFWRQTAYTSHRAAFRREQQRSDTYHATWSSADWNGDGPSTKTTHDSAGAEFASAAPLKDMKLARSYTQLGLGYDATSDAVKAAFRKLARELHPDVSKLPKDEAENRFKTLNEAYMYIKLTNGW